MLGQQDSLCLSDQFLPLFIKKPKICIGDIDTMAFIKYHVKNKILIDHIHNIYKYGFMDSRFVRCFSPGCVISIMPCEEYGPRRFGRCVCDICCFLKGHVRNKKGIRPYAKKQNNYDFVPYYYSPGFVKSHQKYNYDTTSLSYHPIEQYRMHMAHEDEEILNYRKLLHSGDVVKERGRHKVPQYCFFKYMYTKERHEEKYVKKVYDNPSLRIRKFNSYFLKIIEDVGDLSECLMYKEYIVSEDVEIYRAKIARVLI